VAPFDHQPHHISDKPSISTGERAETTDGGQRSDQASCNSCRNFSFIHPARGLRMPGSGIQLSSCAASKTAASANQDYRTWFSAAEDRWRLQGICLDWV
jgi:hypothetical protein